MVAARAVEYVPAEHAVQADVCSPEPLQYVPAAQDWHVVASVAPRAVEYVPGPQSVQDRLDWEPVVPE
jgi:hypothetical protein